MRRRARRSTVLAAIALAALSAAAPVGCGVSDPYRSTPTTAGHRGPRIVDNEVLGKRPTAQAVPAGAVAPSSRAALTRFAGLYINWTWRDLAGHRRRLAAISVGEAAAAERRAIAETARDYELRGGRIENHGRIVAIAPLQGRPGRWVVVSHEITTGKGTYQGLPAAYHVTLATVRPADGGWVVSRWEPRS